MIRLAVSVEGQTEEEFIKTVLAPHLRSFGVAAQPILLGRARNQRIGGGNVTLEGLVSEMVHLKQSFDAVTSLVDFYGFSGNEGKSADELENSIRSKIEVRIGWQGDNVVPYVQRHEFEGLLFSDVDAFSVVPDLSAQVVSVLGEIRSGFGTPEDINDSTSTAPSRRIGDVVPRYRKRLHGPLIAEQTGIAKIRAECPRFNVWLKSLEALEGTTDS